MSRSIAFHASLIGAVIASSPVSAAPCARHLLDAALVSGVSADRLRKVMMAESAGQPTAISSAGAMGCMQLMPGTWQELTVRYALGRDPFDPRANMLGGALYLAEMIGRYGWPHALAAYHAGPGRLNQMLQTGRPLPSATISYMFGIGERSSIPTTSKGSAETAAADWRDAAIFVPLRSWPPNGQPVGPLDTSSDDQQ